MVVVVLFYIFKRPKAAQDGQIYALAGLVT
jgi:hypothetical protein